MTLPRNEPGWPGKIAAFAIGTILLVLGFMFSLIVLAGVSVAVLIAFSYFWWKTRALRKAMRDAPPDVHSAGEIFEGEAVIVEEYRGERSTRLPDQPAGTP